MMQSGGLGPSPQMMGRGMQRPMQKPMGGGMNRPQPMQRPPMMGMGQKPMRMQAPPPPSPMIGQQSSTMGQGNMGAGTMGQGPRPEMGQMMGQPSGDMGQMMGSDNGVSAIQQPQQPMGPSNDLLDKLRRGGISGNKFGGGY